MPRFCIPRMLARYCDGQLELSVSCSSVEQLLSILKADYPNLFSRICDEKGRLRPHVNIFVNDDLLVDRGDLNQPLVDTDTVSVFQAVSGG